MKVKDLVLMALFVALYVVLEYMDHLFGIFKMPQGGQIAFSVIAIVFAGYILGPFRAFGVTILAFVVRFILITPSNVVHPLQFVLDYILAPGSFAFVALVPTIKLKNSITLPLGVLIAGVFQFLFANLSGWFFFSQYYPGDVLFGVMVYNATYIIPTVIVAFVIVAFTQERIVSVAKQRFSS